VKKVRIIQVECVEPGDTTDLKTTAKVVEVKDDAHYADMFAAAGLLFDPKTTAISYAESGSGNFYGTVDPFLDSPDDGETVMTVDRALLGQMVLEGEEPAGDAADSEEHAPEAEEGQPTAGETEGTPESQFYCVIHAILPIVCSMPHCISCGRVVVLCTLLSSVQDVCLKSKDALFDVKTTHAYEYKTPKIYCTLRDCVA
jgi:hypothetical protein